MKTSIVLTSMFVGCALHATTACSSSSDGPARADTPDGGGATTLPDASTGVPAPDASTTPIPDMCSPAGWCPTTLPNSDFLVQDVWPLENSAFAVGVSPTAGVKVMEWTTAMGSWSYIDDNTQNEFGLGDYVGSLWAPNESELYYTVSPGFVYHGTRGMDATWTWKRFQLPDNGPAFTAKDNGYPFNYPLSTSVPGFPGYPALGVRGTSANDVYAWFSNTVFHWKDDGSGTPSWVAEFSVEAPTTLNEMVTILSAAVSPSGEMWFSGARSFRGGYASCSLLIHKGASGYSLIADGTASNPWDSSTAGCTAKADYFALRGWMVDLQFTPSGRMFGLDYDHGVVELLPGATNADWSFRGAKSSFIGISNAYVSMWKPSDTEAWLSGDGIVVRGLKVPAEGGTWEISSIAENGAPIRSTFYRIRGTSTSNIWAVGNGYAIHKTANP